MTPLSNEARELAGLYMPFAYSLAKPWKAKKPRWRDDFESAALAGLCDAARTFDPSKGVKFATFASNRINGALFDIYRDLSIWESRFKEKGEARPNLAAPAKSEAERIEDLEWWTRKVSARQARILRLIYIQGLTQLEAAKAVGLAQSRVCDLHRDALRRLATVSA